jgi:hypothetical protein
VILECPGKNKDVVKVREIRAEFPQKVVPEAQKHLGGVVKAEGHDMELE